MKTVNTPWTNVLSDFPDLFRQANLQLARQALEREGKPSGGGKGHRLLLSGLLHCDCGEPFGGQEPATGSAPGDRGLRCLGRKMGNGCSRKKAISLRLVETAVLTKLGDFISGPRYQKEYLDVLVQTSDSLAASRATERHALDLEIRALEQKLDRKNGEDVPDDVEVKASRQRVLADLGREIREKRSKLNNIKAPVPVHELAGIDLGTLAGELDHQISICPAVYQTVGQLRFRIAVRQIVTAIKFVFVDNVTVDLHMTFDFRGEDPHDDAPGVFLETARISLLTDKQAKIARMRELAVKQDLALTVEEIRAIDETAICRRLFAHLCQEERTSLYNTLLLIMATRCTIAVAAEECGIRRDRFYYLVLDLRNRFDLSTLHKLFCSMRPDLDLSAKALDTKQVDYKSVRLKLTLVQHPLLNHPMAQSSEDRDIDDAEWNVVLGAVRDFELWERNSKKFRNHLNAFFYLLRTGNRYIDLDPRYGDPRRFSNFAPTFLYDGDLARITPPLLRHAGLTDEGEEVVCKTPPTFNGRNWGSSEYRYERALVPRASRQGDAK